MSRKKKGILGKINGGTREPGRDIVLVKKNLKIIYKGRGFYPTLKVKSSGGSKGAT